MMIVIDLVEGTVERHEAQRRPKGSAQRDALWEEPPIPLPQAGIRQPEANPTPHPLAGQEVATFLRRMEGA